MDDEIDLAALRVFRGVARAGSFSAAARAMQLPKSTVSKRVRDLETALEVRLIERTTRRMRVTPEGDLLAQRADRLLQEAEEIRRDIGLSTRQAAGHLRIAVPSFFGMLVLGRVAPLCRARHPRLTLEFVFLDRLPDLLQEGFDGAIAYGPLADSDLVVRTLATGEAVPVAAPGFLGDAWPDSPAALAGGGVAMLPEFLAEAGIAAGRLVRLLPDWEGTRRQIVFVYPSPQSVTARLRAFLDVLVEDTQAYQRGSRG